jgi:hypothetical protein
MNFSRKKKGGWNRRTRKLWVSDDGHYKIVWSKECGGAEVEPAYYATVRCVTEDGFTHWAFVGARRHYRTFRAAVEACEFNRKLWDAVLAADPPKVMRIRELEIRGRVGTGVTFNRILNSLPVWVNASPRLLEVLYAKRKREVIEEETLPSESSTLIETPVEPTRRRASGSRKPRTTKSSPVAAKGRGKGRGKTAKGGKRSGAGKGGGK